MLADLFSAALRKLPRFTIHLDIAAPGFCPECKRFKRYLYVPTAHKGWREKRWACSGPCYNKRNPSAHACKGVRHGCTNSVHTQENIEASIVKPR